MLFKGVPQKVRIISNNVCYGPAPEADDEIEQHITLNADGRVWFSAYNFGAGFGEHEKARSKIYKIDAEPITSIAVWNLTRATKAIITLPMRTIFQLVIM